MFALEVLRKFLERAGSTAAVKGFGCRPGTAVRRGLAAGVRKPDIRSRYRSADLRSVCANSSPLYSSGSLLTLASA
jgi:hypothetical protein